MKLKVTNVQGAAIGEVEVKLPVIENNRGTQAVHDTVVAHLANRRMGTACTKTAGEVAGTNKKPWRQKGTGRARAGSFQSPLWVGGGVVFGPRPRDFGKKVNRKTRQLALLKALGERIKSGEVSILDEIKLTSPKTKAMVGMLAALDIEGTALLVVDSLDNNVLLAARNLRHVEVVSGDNLNTYQVLKSDRLLIAQSAWSKLEARLQ